MTEPNKSSTEIQIIQRLEVQDKHFKDLGLKYNNITVNADNLYEVEKIRKMLKKERTTVNRLYKQFEKSVYDKLKEIKDSLDESINHIYPIELELQARIKEIRDELAKDKLLRIKNEHELQIAISERINMWESKILSVKKCLDRNELEAELDMINNDKAIYREHGQKAEETKKLLKAAIFNRINYLNTIEIEDSYSKEKKALMQPKAEILVNPVNKMEAQEEKEVNHIASFVTKRRKSVMFDSKVERDTYGVSTKGVKGKDNNCDFNVFTVGDYTIGLSKNIKFSTAVRIKKLITKELKNE